VNEYTERGVNVSGYLQGWTCALVRRCEEDGSLLVDNSTVTVGSGEYWATARQVATRPGAMVAVWFADNLVISGWQEGPLGAERALRRIESSVPQLVLLRAEWDEFFPVGGKGFYEDQVRVTTSVTGP
jgi:hypothetical protein